MEKLYFRDIQHLTTRSAIRHWQRVGLLPDDREAKGNLNFRTFDPELLPRIQEIARLRRAGLSCIGIGLYLKEMDKRALERQVEKAVEAELSEDVLRSHDQASQQQASCTGETILEPNGMGHLPVDQTQVGSS